ncbi:DUF4097 family beta strand repeat-containing protein [Microbispora sp. H11081]|uniref:DUF4097 family beta strand repeat-containing protein n=1 Tax=Microbispora sp. H11081 TaxID=2729107 RepID=UPI001472F6F5|nr:DUF4097 family beta strand repeat-containing protein [Microbispora sp. H11081]
MTGGRQAGARTFDTPRPILAVLDVATAAVRVNASDRADTVVDIRPSDESNDADVQAARHIQVDYADGRLLVRTAKEQAATASGWGLSLGKLVESPSNWARSLLLGRGSAEVTIDLPAGSHLDATTAGVVLCRGTLGEVTAATSYGDIRIEQAARLRVRSTHGDISVIRVSGHAEVTTTHGGIHIGEVDGTAVVKTSHGSVRIREVTGELRLSSAHGDLAVDRALAGVAAKTAYAGLRIGEAVSGSIVMETTGGGLDLGIREGTAAWLDVSSTYGVVDVSLDPGDDPGRADRVVEVRTHTTYGDVVIHRA